MSSYLIYVTTKDHNPSDQWGGCHITMAGTHKNTEKTVTKAIKSAAENTPNKPWHPSDWEIQQWKGRYTMVITTKRLVAVAEKLKDQGIPNLKGPSNGASKFHVTLPKDLPNKEKATQYAKLLSKKKWYLTVAEKQNTSCAWRKYVLLTK